MSCSLGCPLPTSQTHTHPTHRQTVRRVNAPMRRRLQAAANHAGTHLRGHTDACASQIHLGVHRGRPQLPSPPRGRVAANKPAYVHSSWIKHIYSYKYVCYIFVQFSWAIWVLYRAMYIRLILIIKRYQAISAVFVFKFDLSLREGVVQEI
jgi:hypothetical protein